MADIASVFHWPPEKMDRMPVDELMRWRDAAIRRSPWHKHPDEDEDDG